MPADDSLAGEYYPLGRRVWRVAGGICQQEGGVEHQLTLTTCTSGDQFSCDDGTCVSMDQVIQ